MSAMPVIRVSEAVQVALHEKGRMNDSYDSVLRKLLGLPPVDPAAPRANKGGRGRKRTDVTPRATYVRLIPEILKAMPGRQAKASAVLAALEKRLSGKFTAADRQAVSNGQPYWHNSAEWGRKILVADGVLLPTSASGYGVWKLA